MRERIPAQIIDTIDLRQPVRLTPAQAGGPIHTRSFTGLYRNLRLYGAGLLMLFRHRASLGGINVVALFLQERLGWRAGQVQMVLDVLILLAAFGVTDPWRVALSVLGAVVLKLALAINHRPGRYMAV